MQYLLKPTQDAWHLAARLSVQMSKYCILNGNDTKNELLVEMAVAIRSGDVKQISAALLTINDLLPNDHQQVT